MSTRFISSSSTEYLPTGTYTTVSPPNTTSATPLVIGSWTGDVDVFSSTHHHAIPSRGLYLADLHYPSGIITPTRMIPMKNPSWLTFHPKNNQIVYSVGEHGEGIAGDITTMKLFHDEDGYNTTVLHTTQTLGEQPTHSCVTHDGKYIIIANYGCIAGTSAITIGKIDQETLIVTEIVQKFDFLIGTNENPTKRQESGHAHCAVINPISNDVYCCDLGNDIVRVYQYNETVETSSENTQYLPFSHHGDLDIIFPPGSGPRHLIFSRNGKYLYICTELYAQLHIFKLDENILKYVEIDVINLYSEEHNDKSSAKGASGLILSHDEQFLYVMNRGYLNQICVFSLHHEDSHHVKLIQIFSVGEDGPRTLEIDPSGRFMVVSNVQSGSVVCITIECGFLEKITSFLNIETPTDVKFIKF